VLLRVGLEIFGDLGLQARILTFAYFRENDMKTA
jgi:hypothetical protein